MADVSRSRAALAAAVSLARTYGLRIDDPAVLAGGFSLMVHLLSAWVPKLRAAVADCAANEIPRGLAAVSGAVDLLSPAERPLLVDTAERLHPLWMAPGA